MVLNGRFVPPGTPLHAVVPSVHYLSLIAAPRFLRAETTVDGTRIVLLQRPTRLAMRIASGRARPRSCSTRCARSSRCARRRCRRRRAELVVVEAPLRLNLTAAGEGDVIVSDRAAQGDRRAAPVSRAAARAGGVRRAAAADAGRRASRRRDYYWVSEGVSYVLAERFLNRIEPERRNVYDWIDLFNVFAVVDRFESTPKIPFVGAFFPRAQGGRSAARRGVRPSTAARRPAASCSPSCASSSARRSSTPCSTLSAGAGAAARLRGASSRPTRR